MYKNPECRECKNRDITNMFYALTISFNSIKHKMSKNDLPTKEDIDILENIIEKLRAARLVAP